MNHCSNSRKKIMNYYIYKDLTVSPVQTLCYKNNINNILIVIIDIAATKALWVVARTQCSVWFLTNNVQYLYDTLFQGCGSIDVVQLSSLSTGLCYFYFIFYFFAFPSSSRNNKTSCCPQQATQFKISIAQIVSKHCKNF